MSRGVSHSTKTASLSPVLEETDLALTRARQEAQAVRGVRTVSLWFADADGPRRWFRDVTGAGMVALDDDHPATRAFAADQPLIETSDGDPWIGFAVDGVDDPLGVLSVLLDRDADPDTPRFELGAIAQRLGGELDVLSRRWERARMELALEFTSSATGRFLNETSFHRAVRLGLTELSELAGARETQLWALDPDGDPVCVAQPAGGNPSADRDRAIRRLASSIGASGDGATRVPDTATSRHFGWALDDGVRRFVAVPVRAHDRAYGVIMIVDYTTAPALGSIGLPPGLDRASDVFAASIGAALFSSEIGDHAAQAKSALEETHRRMEAGERDSARYELCRLAAGELKRELATLARDLPEVEEAMPEALYHERMRSLRERCDRGGALLNELELLTERPPARLALTSINDVVHEIIAEIEEDADFPAVRVSRRLEGELPELLLDASQIRDVLIALLRHGVSGTEEREAIVATRRQKGDVVVEVSFPEREVLGGVLDSLFRPFHGLTEGTGHPLSLADQIVGEHGGQLRARSEGGEGLVYWLSLPVADNQDRRRRPSDRRGVRDRRDTLPRDEG